jgi:hypothetical protein
MSKRGADFLERWIVENVYAQATLARSGDARPKVLAEQCAADVLAVNISVSEIEEEVGDLEIRMAEAINAARHGRRE